MAPAFAVCRRLRLRRGVRGLSRTRAWGRASRLRQSTGLWRRFCRRHRPAPPVRDLDRHADALARRRAIGSGARRDDRCARLLFPRAKPRSGRMRHVFGRAWVTAAALFASVEAAEAHIVASRLGDFYTGALHPLTDLQDLILWAAMGVLAGSLGTSRGRWLVLLFPLGLLAGLVLNRAFGNVSAGSAADAGIILVLGLLLAAQARIPTALLGLIAFGLAVLRGAANAGDVGPETNQLLYAAGLVCAGYAAITLTMALTLAFRRAEVGTSMAWRGIAIRAVGGWIAAIGIMMVGLALAS